MIFSVKIGVSAMESRLYIEFKWTKGELTLSKCVKYFTSFILSDLHVLYVHFVVFVQFLGYLCIAD